METLFGSQKVTLEDLEGLIEQASLTCKEWLGMALLEGKIDRLVDALITWGKATSIKDALCFLIEESRGFDPANISVASSDLRRRKDSKRIWDILEKVLQGPGEEKFSEARKHRHFGRIGHEAIPQLFLERLPQEASLLRYRAQEQELALMGNTLAGARYVKQMASDRSSKAYIEEVARLAQETANTLDAPHDSWVDQYQACRGRFRNLVDVLMPVFGTYVDNVLAIGDDPYTRYLTLLTFTSWAHALVWHYQEHVYRKRQRVFVSEVPVVNARHGIAGWRSDGLELIAIDGKAPSVSQTAIALEILAEPRPRSIGDAIVRLSRVFGKNLGLSILEWKFGVGDATGKHDVIEQDKLANGPLKEHLRQVQRYITLACVDCYLLGGRRSIETIWRDSHIEYGTLMYFLYSGISSYRVSLEADERETLFIKEVAQRFPKGKQKALRRVFENFLVRRVINHLYGRPQRANGKSREQGELFSPEIHKLLEHYQKK